MKIWTFCQRALTDGWQKLHGKIIAPLNDSQLKKRCFAVYEKTKSKISGLDAALVFSLAILSLVLLLSGAGSYVDDALFYRPVMKMRHAVGRSPTLSPDIRLVLLEDRSLQKLGRQPNFGEWYQVGKSLFTIGYERVLLLGVHTLSGEVGEPGERHDKGLFFAGSVVADSNTNNRARAISSLPTTLLVPREPTKQLGAFASAEIGLLPEAQILPYLDGIGTLNIFGNYVMPTGYDVGENFVLPNLAYEISAGLRWQNNAPGNSRGNFAQSYDRSFLVDFVAPTSLTAAAVPASAFFSADGQSVKDGKQENLSEALKERLRGGRIAILVPDAFTGSRFVDSPMGKVLSYAAAVSAANSVLSGRMLTRPLPDFVYLLIWIVALFAFARVKKPWLALRGSAVLLVLNLLIAAGFLVFVGWQTPAASMFVLGINAWFVRFVYQMLVTTEEKASMAKDLEMGRAVQELLLAKTTRGRIGGWDYAIIYRPFKSMAGDWYQIFDTKTQAPGALQGILAIGDVVGKGPSAALNTAVIAGVWNGAFAKLQHDVDAAQTNKESAELAAAALATADVSKVNLAVENMINTLDQTIGATFRGQQNSTLSLAMLMQAKIRIFNRAAPRWTHITAQGTTAAKLRTPPHDPLGAAFAFSAELPINQGMDLEVQPGDIIFAYTDGVMEGVRADRALRKSLESKPLNTMADNALEDLAERALSSGMDDALPDDQTIMLLRWRP